MTPTAMSSLTGRYSYFNGGLLDWFVSWNSITAVWTAACLYKLKKTEIEYSCSWFTGCNCQSKQNDQERNDQRSWIHGKRNKNEGIYR